MIITFAGYANDRSIDSLTTFILHHHTDDTVKVNALNELSSQHLWKDYYASLQHADDALTLARKLNYAKGIITANNLKSFCYWAFGDNDLAIEMALEAATLAEQNGLLSMQAESFLNLSRAYADLGERDKANDYIDIAGKILLKTENWQQISNLYNWRGVLYVIADKPDSALLYYQKALSVAEAHHLNVINSARIISNIGECYLDTNTDTAFSYFNKALQLARDTGNKTAEASILSIMGQAVLALGDQKTADSYFQQSLLIARKLGLRRALRSVYAGMVRLKEQQGKTSEAMAYLRAYYNVRDSLLNTSKARLIVELEAKHEMDKKEQAIKLLEQEKRIEELWRNILIFGVLVAAVFSVFIYRVQVAKTRRTRQLLELQQEAHRTKTNFFNSISHEFRTPLTLVLAPLEVVMKKKLSPEVQENLTLAKRNARRLLELVNQLLDIAKLESGHMELEVSQGDLRQFFGEITHSFDSLSEPLHVDFDKVIKIPADPCWFDRDKLEKIITNLLGNAFRYTPPGGRVKLSALSDGKLLTISVSDTGPGIPEEEQARIFTPFHQGKQAGHQLGTGLGLSLVNELVKLYNGRIAIQSSIGSGSTFTVTLSVSRESFSANQFIGDLRTMPGTSSWQPAPQAYGTSGD